MKTVGKKGRFPAFRSQAGVTMISVFIVAAFIGIFILVISSSLSQNMFVRRLLSTGDGYRDIESDLQTGLGAELRQLLLPASGTCSGGTVAINRSVGTNGVSYATKQNLPAWPGDAPATHTAAVQRCNSGVRSPPSSGDFYFCVQFGGLGNTQYGATSFIAAPMAIAEVRARVFDPTSGASLSCAAYQTLYANNQANPGVNGQASMEIAYSIYWYGKGNPRVYKRRNGAFYAPPL